MELVNIWVNDMGTNLESGSETPPTTVVIEAIAEHEGLDPMDLEQPLYEVINTDALDSIIGYAEVAQAPSDIDVRFSYNGCRVHVSGDGSVAVRSSHSG